MSRIQEPPHLYLRPAKYVRGKLRARAVWCVVDGQKEVSTGCGIDERQGAEKALAEYLAEKHEPSRTRNQPIDHVLIADVCGIYLRDKVPEHDDPAAAASRIEQLLEWWGDKTLADVNGRSCRDYVAWRCTHQWKSSKPEVTGNPARMVTAAGARRELEHLRAAVNYHQEEGLHREVVKVTLPPKGASRTRYLTRAEFAKMLLIAWRLRENATVGRGKRKGQPVLSKKRPARHIARFLLVGVYTGRRASAICEAAFEPTPGYGWIDLKRGLYYRADQHEVETNKRQPTILIPRRLLMHLRRWKRLNPKQKFVVEFRGKPVREVNKGFARIAELAGLGPDVVPHTLRHTCATWLSERGASFGDAANFLGMSQKIYEATYRHASPTLRNPGFHTVPIWNVFDPKYHASEIIVDDWDEDQDAA